MCDSVSVLTFDFLMTFLCTSSSPSDDLWGHQSRGDDTNYLLQQLKFFWENRRLCEEPRRCEELYGCSLLASSLSFCPGQTISTSRYRFTVPPCQYHIFISPSELTNICFVNQHIGYGVTSRSTRVQCYFSLCRLAKSSCRKSNSTDQTPCDKAVFYLNWALQIVMVRPSCSRASTPGWLPQIASKYY